MGLLERISQSRSPARSIASFDDWAAWRLGLFAPGGQAFDLGLNTTWTVDRAHEFTCTLPSYTQALKWCPPAFAAQMVRALVLSQARFTFRNLRYASTPKKLFGTRDLAVLERPWPNGTTGELVARMEWHAGLAGNSYVYRQPQRLRVLRPDWVTVVYGSEQEPDDAAHALDGELIGYVYINGGWGSGNKPQVLLPEEVSHWSPLPDPESAGIGMSWITPALREIQGDLLSAQHKIRFFEHGATPNLVVKGLPAQTAEQFNTFVDMMEGRHAGVANAYRTLYLTAGADATVVGADLRQIDFKNVQGAGETRIAFLSRVPAPLLGIAEGLAGSSLNAGNFASARRMFADSWIYPTLQDAAAALASIVNVPADAELWFDTSDMPILREDELDVAEIMSRKMLTIESGVRAGFEPDSIVAAVDSGDLTLLRHTGLYSVQLQPPMSGLPAASGSGTAAPTE